MLEPEIIDLIDTPKQKYSLIKSLEQIINFSLGKSPMKALKFHMQMSE
jgi:hypothetical protein